MAENANKKKEVRFHFVFDLDGTLAEQHGDSPPIRVKGANKVLDEAYQLGEVHLCSWNYAADVILKALDLDAWFKDDSELVPCSQYDWYQEPKWQRVTERYKLPAGKCIAFDDDECEVNGYLKHGVKCYHVKNGDLAEKWAAFKKEYDITTL